MISREQHEPPITPRERHEPSTTSLVESPVAPSTRPASPGAVQPGRSARGRGRLVLDVGRCTACVICAQECPVWCITVASHPEPVSESLAGRPARRPAAAGRGRARTHNVLDLFTIDFGLCMYCSICVEVCPFDALHWAPVPVPSGHARVDLLHDAELLTAHQASVPEPEALEAGSVTPEPGRRTRR